MLDNFFNKIPIEININGEDYSLIIDYYNDEIYYGCMTSDNVMYKSCICTTMNGNIINGLSNILKQLHDNGY